MAGLAPKVSQRFGFRIQRGHPPRNPALQEGYPLFLRGEGGYKNIYIYIYIGIFMVFGGILMVFLVFRGAAFLVGVSWDGAGTVWAGSPVLLPAHSGEGGWPANLRPGTCMLYPVRASRKGLYQVRSGLVCILSVVLKSANMNICSFSWRTKLERPRPRYSSIGGVNGPKTKI